VTTTLIRVTNALATQEYERAIALDSNHAPAHRAGLAAGYASSTVSDDARPLEVWLARETPLLAPSAAMRVSERRKSP
jgi:hypothetical protein